MGPTDDFREGLIKIGIVRLDEQDTLWTIAKHCAKATGVPMAVTGALFMSKVTTVTVPGVGTIPGAVAGFLAGLASGTAMCVSSNVAFRNELRKFLK